MDQLTEDILRRLVAVEQETKTHRHAEVTPVGQTYWDDQQVNISTIRLPGVSDPTWTNYKGSQVLAFAKNQDNVVYFTAQLTHRYIEETDIHYHIHTVYPDANAGTVRWIFTYSWASQEEDFPAETTVTTEIESPLDADNHTYEAIAEGIDGTGKTISSILLCSLTREGMHVNDDYDNVVYLAATDFHLEVDGGGSREETQKDLLFRILLETGFFILLEDGSRIKKEL